MDEIDFPLKPSKSRWIFSGNDLYVDCFVRPKSLHAEMSNLSLSLSSNLLVFPDCPWNLINAAQEDISQQQRHTNEHVN